MGLLHDHQHEVVGVGRLQPFHGGYLGDLLTRSAQLLKHNAVLANVGQPSAPCQDLDVVSTLMQVRRVHTTQDASTVYQDLHLLLLRLFAIAACAVDPVSAPCVRLRRDPRASKQYAVLL